MNICGFKELDLITEPFFLSFKINKAEEIGFEHKILDDLIVKEDYIKRIYFLTSTQKTIRGNHAHLNQFQILILINGDAQLKLIDCKGATTEWNLDFGPVLIPKNYWIELNMAEFSKVLCLASSTHSELKSQYNMNNFLQK
jgi:hypothetical protein